jgi:hypothetical protein
MIFRCWYMLIVPNRLLACLSMQGKHDQICNIHQQNGASFSYV